jgi:hypothetical protein
MARVITLDGLKTKKLGRRYRKCRRTVVVYSPTIGEEIEVCEGNVSKRTRAPKKRRSTKEVSGMARKRARKKSAGMRKGSCKIKKRRCICRSKAGKVKFAKRSRCKR